MIRQTVHSEKRQHPNFCGFLAPALMEDNLHHDCKVGGGKQPLLIRIIPNVLHLEDLRSRDFTFLQTIERCRNSCLLATIVSKTTKTEIKSDLSL